MSDNETQATKGKLPTHNVYISKKDATGKDHLNEIGVAWAHKTGGGFNIQLFANPIDGKITVFPVSEKK